MNIWNFFDQMPGLPRAALIGLLALWAGLLYGGFFFGTYRPDTLHRMPRWARLSASFVLVMVAWLLMLTWQSPYRMHYARWLALGMTFGFIGDLFMAKLLIRSALYLPFGMGAFAVGHLCYLAGMMQALRAVDMPIWTGRFVGITATWLMIGLIGWYITVYRGQSAGGMLYAALGYGLLLCATAAFAMNLSLQKTAFIGLFVGTLLFLMSDLVLSMRLFSGARWSHLGDVVWLLYSTGQMLIVTSSLFFPESLNGS